MNLTIWQRIFLTIALPSFLATVLLVIELYDLKVIYHKISYIETIDDINIILMQLRRYEKNILLFEEDEEEYIQRFNNYMDKLKKAINRVALEVTPQLSQSHFQHILTYIDQYNQKTHEIIIMIGLKHKLIQDIRPVGRNIAESSSNKIEVLELRRFEKNYIIYEENNAVQEVHKIAKTLCSKEPELIALFDIYLNLFDSLVTNNFQINETLQVMRTDARKIETLLQQLSENERIEMHNKIINMRNFFITALVAIVFISAIGGYFLSDRIVTTLKNMELAFKRLVNDDILIKVYENKGPIEVRHLVASYNQAATELKKIRAELTNKVQKLRKTNQVLVERQEELVEARKMTAMRLISSEIAHELNNPISSLTLLLQVFYEQLDVENPQKKLVHQMLKDTLRCQNALHALVDFAQKEPLKLKEVSLAEFIADTNDIVKRLNPDKDVLVTVSLEMVPEKITIDTTLMQQALINILTNAYQFTPENGEIKIRVYLEDSQFVIAVQDSGPGISNEALPNIFEPFFSTRKENGGTGLGLAIAKKIVDRHSGRISAKNNYGNGSTFTITLPLQHCTVISSSKRDKQAA